MEQRWTVEEREAGERLDRWLCRRLAGISRKRVKVFLDAGRVRVGSRRVVIAGWELAAGDVVSIAAKEERARPARDAKARASHGAPPSTGRRGAPHGVALRVYYEDRDVIVVEKPAGLLSVPQPSSARSENLLALVREHLRRRYREGQGSFVAPLHRLDAETSGVMAFALSKRGQRLEAQFRDHSIKRSYVAIVEGAVGREQGIIDRPLAKGEHGAGRKTRVAGRGEGVRAVTAYRVKERYRTATVLEVNVRTGRTHQIRAHLAAEGHPLIGDAVYGDARARGGLGFRRHALHACVLGFRHPASGKPMLFHSPLPEDLKALIDRLRSEV